MELEAVNEFSYLFIAGQVTHKRSESKYFFQTGETFVFFSQKFGLGKNVHCHQCRKDVSLKYISELEIEIGASIAHGFLCLTRLFIFIDFYQSVNLGLVLHTFLLFHIIYSLIDFPVRAIIINLI